jgi:hypothetical protein
MPNFTKSLFRPTLKTKQKKNIGRFELNLRFLSQVNRRGRRMSLGHELSMMDMAGEKSARRKTTSDVDIAIFNCSNGQYVRTFLLSKQDIFYKR